MRVGRGGQNLPVPSAMSLLMHEAHLGVGCGHGPALPTSPCFRKNFENPRILSWNQAFQVVLND